MSAWRTRRPGSHDSSIWVRAGAILSAVVAVVALASFPVVVDAQPNNEHQHVQLNESETWAIEDDEFHASSEARIAYFVQVSTNQLPLLSRLLHVLYHPDNVYGVHVDAKENHTAVVEFVRAFRESCRGCSNVHFMPGETVAYRGITMILNTLYGMDYLLDVDKSWEVFINLSAADYPLLSPENQRRAFGHREIRHRGYNFMTLFPRTHWKEFAVKRLKRIHLDTSVPFNPQGEMVPTTLAHPLFDRMGFKLIKAEAWMMVSREFVSECVTGALARRMLVNLSFLLSSPEHFFITVLLNHPNFAHTLVPSGFRTVFWFHNHKSSGQHPFNADTSIRGKYVFYDQMVTTAGFFARKFRYSNAPIMRKIDAEVSGVAHVPTSPERVEAFRRRTFHAFLNMTREVAHGRRMKIS